MIWSLRSRTARRIKIRDDGTLVLITECFVELHLDFIGYAEIDGRHPPPHIVEIVNNRNIRLSLGASTENFRGDLLNMHQTKPSSASPIADVPPLATKGFFRTTCSCCAGSHLCSSPMAALAAVGSCGTVFHTKIACSDWAIRNHMIGIDNCLAGRYFRFPSPARLLLRRAADGVTTRGPQQPESGRTCHFKLARQ